jgi:hypothetical protein
MANLGTKTIVAALAAGAFSASAAAQGTAAPPAGGAAPRSVTIGDTSIPSRDRRSLGEALVTLHSFLEAQTRVARTVTMNPNSPAVAELAASLGDDLNEIALDLSALGQRLGVAVEPGGPLGPTETARAWAHEQRLLELEGLRGRSLDTAYLAPLPDELRFGLGLVNAAKLTGTLDPEVLRFLNDTGVRLQSYVERSRDLLAPRIRVATAAERTRG